MDFSNMKVDSYVYLPGFVFTVLSLYSNIQLREMFPRIILYYVYLLHAKLNYNVLECKIKLEQHVK